MELLFLMCHYSVRIMSYWSHHAYCGLYSLIYPLSCMAFVEFRLHNPNSSVNISETVMCLGKWLRVIQACCENFTTASDSISCRCSSVGKPFLTAERRTKDQSFIMLDIFSFNYRYTNINLVHTSSDIRNNVRICRSMVFYCSSDIILIIRRTPCLSKAVKGKKHIIFAMMMNFSACFKVMATYKLNYVWKKLKQISLSCLSRAKLRMQGEKRGRDVPGPLKKVLGLLDFFGPGTTGPRDLQGL